jgi:UDP-glucuronate 4-epimerase
VERLLVTGALGFVGLNIVRAAALRGWQVDALTRRDPDATARAFLADVDDRVRWHHGDVGDRSGMAALLAKLKPNRVLHAAAVTATPEQERADPARVFDVNAGGTLNLLEAARHAGVARFVFVSSSGIYGAAPPTPKRTEEGPLQIGGLYAIGKQTSEALCSRYAEMYDMSVAVGRLGTAYGPMERTTGSRSGMSSVQRAALKALDGEQLTVHSPGIARDFCYVVDIAEAFVALLASEALTYPIYNVAGPEAAPLRTALETLSDAVPGFSWREVDDPADAELAMLPAKARAGLDLSRLAKDTGWHPEHDLDGGIRAYLAWLRSEAAAGRSGS